MRLDIDGRGVEIGTGPDGSPILAGAQRAARFPVDRALAVEIAQTYEITAARRAHTDLRLRSRNPQEST